MSVARSSRLICLEKSIPAHVLRRRQDAGGELVDHLGDLVERVGQLLDVLALQRGDEGGIDGVADFAA